MILRDFVPILNWDTNDQLITNFTLFNDKKISKSPNDYNCKQLEMSIKTKDVRDTAVITISVLKPSFMSQLKYILTGQIECKGDKRTYKCDFNPLTIFATDFSNSIYDLKHINVILGAQEDLIAYLEASEETVLICIIKSKLLMSLQKVLEIDCSLRKVEVNSENDYYFVEGVSRTVDGCMIGVPKEIESSKAFPKISIHHRDCEQFIQLLHYLQSQIPSIVFVPLRNRDEICEWPESEDVSETFKGSVKKQIQISTDFFKKIMKEPLKEESDTNVLHENIVSKENLYKEFREKLIIFENECDLVSTKLKFAKDTQSDESYIDFL